MGRPELSLLARIRRLPFIVIVCLAVALYMIEGCTVIQFNRFSAPSLTEGVKLCGFGLRIDSVFSDHQIPQPNEKIKDNCVRLDLPGIRLAIRPMNVVTTSEWLAPWPLPPFIPSGGQNPKDVPPPFMFELRVDPEGGEVKFDPSRVSLTMEDGRILQPTSSYGPTFTTVFPGANRIATRRRYPCAGGESDKLFGPTTIGQLSCFWLRFDVSSSPEQSYILSVRGIEKEGIPITIPAIRFETGSDWVFGTIP
jgi:hypothetical protein